MTWREKFSTRMLLLIGIFAMGAGTQEAGGLATLLFALAAGLLLCLAVAFVWSVEAGTEEEQREESQ